MRRNLMILSLMALAVSLVLAEGMDAETVSAPLALNGSDPVALIGGSEVEGREDLTLESGLYTYRFASRKNLEKFRSDPEHWGIQGNGKCLMAPSADSNPGIYAVHDGRIYVFASRGCVQDFADDPDYALNPPEYEERNVAILLYDGVELLDFAGPGEVFAAAASGRAFNVYTVAASEATVMSQGFVQVKPEFTFENSPQPDILLVPGGAARNVVRDEKSMAWIEKVAADAITLSVCNGAFVLASAGLLDGKEATTHHGSIDALRRIEGIVKVHDDRRFVDNGSVITSAGVSAGIDMSLYLVERLLGPERATGVARYMEYDWSPEEQPGLVLRAATNE